MGFKGIDVLSNRESGEEPERGKGIEVSALRGKGKNKMQRPTTARHLWVLGSSSVSPFGCHLASALDFPRGGGVGG